MTIYYNMHLTCLKNIFPSLVFCLIILRSIAPVAAQSNENRTEALKKVMQMEVIDGDTIYINALPAVTVYGKSYKAKALTQEQKEEFWRLIRDVKRTLPYAKIISSTLIETYEYMETMPAEKMQREHLKKVEKELLAEYKPKMKKLTLRQGKLLIKLINRQCNQSSYHIVKAFFGGFKAFWWNMFAGFFGASLKTGYDPINDSTDAFTERIVLLVEEGRL